MLNFYPLWQLIWFFVVILRERWEVKRDSNSFKNYKFYSVPHAQLIIRSPPPSAFLVLSAEITADWNPGGLQEWLVFRMTLFVALLYKDL